MSWHCSQALAEVFSEADSKAGGLFAGLNEIDTASTSSYVVKMKGSSTHFQSGMTLEHSTGNRLVDAWISLQQDFLANRLVTQGNYVEQTIHAISGQIHSESLGRWDQNSSSWKMSVGYCLTDTLHKWPGIWPRAGMIVDGVCYRLPKWERPIAEIASGLLHTPAASDHNRSGGAYDQGRDSPTLPALVGGLVHPEFHEWLMGWPIGWTALEPLEMDRFQEWLDLHGTY